MNKEILERLTALLRRVQQRASEPREAKEDEEAPPVSAPPSTLADGMPPPEPAPLVELPPPAIEIDDTPQLEVGADLLDDIDVDLGDAYDDGEDEEEEPAPSSSPRPVGPAPGEQIERAAFGHDEPSAPAIHTPPPDSGRLPKASEAPPPIDDFDVGDVTGVHALERSGEQRAMPREELEALALVPEVTFAEVADAGEVAHVVARAERSTPRTIGELLDATLGL